MSEGSKAAETAAEPAAEAAMAKAPPRPSGSELFSEAHLGFAANVALVELDDVFFVGADDSQITLDVAGMSYFVLSIAQMYAHVAAHRRVLGDFHRVIAVAAVV